MHSKYDNMHVNRIFYALTWTNNHIITSIGFMISLLSLLFSFLAHAVERQTTPLPDINLPSSLLSRPPLATFLLSTLLSLSSPSLMRVMEKFSIAAFFFLLLSPCKGLFSCSFLPPAPFSHVHGGENSSPPPFLFPLLPYLSSHLLSSPFSLFSSFSSLSWSLTLSTQEKILSPHERTFPPSSSPYSPLALIFFLSCTFFAI